MDAFVPHELIAGIGDSFPEDLPAGTDLAILPLGSIEQHGPHLPLGCDSYISIATAKLVAQRTGGALFPLVPYSWVGGLRGWPGTLDIRSKNMGDYLEDVCCGIIGLGFERLLLVNCHGGGRDMTFIIADRVARKTGCPTLAVYPLRVHSRRELGEIWQRLAPQAQRPFCEASEMLGALKILGHEELKERVIAQNESAHREFKDEPRDFYSDALRRVFALSEVGHDYHHEAQHVFPERELYPEAGAQVLNLCADKIAQALEDMKPYTRRKG